MNNTLHTRRRENKQEKLTTMERRRKKMTTQSSESSFDPLSLVCSDHSSTSTSDDILAVWGFSEGSLVIEEEPEWNSGFATPKPTEKWVPLSPKSQVKTTTIEFHTPRNDLDVDGETFYTPSSSLVSPKKRGKKKKTTRQKNISKDDKMARLQLAYFENFQL